jgi:hypothetical protein
MKLLFPYSELSRIAIKTGLQSDLHSVISIYQEPVTEHERQWRTQSLKERIWKVRELHEISVHLKISATCVSEKKGLTVNSHTSVLK